MKIDLNLDHGITLCISAGDEGHSAYPTARIQKGLLLICDGQDLSEEAVGFGVPVLKCGLKAIFPGEVELYPEAGIPTQRITARYKLNLEEKISFDGTGTINNRWVYAGKNTLAAVIRNWPASRRILTSTSNLLRSSLGWTTTYEPAEPSMYVTLTYTLNLAESSVGIELVNREIAIPGVSEVIVMNEQGAQTFTLYQEGGGRLQPAREIDCWDPVSADSATFISSTQRIAFCLPQVEGARLYRGREMVESRLAWAGFGYTFSPDLTKFSYSVTLKKLP
jgi:hypothetical protein